MLLAVKLCCGAFVQEAIVVQFEEDILGNVGLKLGCCTAEDIESNVEPAVYCGVNEVILVAKLLWRALFDEGSCFASRAVFVCACSHVRICMGKAGSIKDTYRRHRVC